MSDDLMMRVGKALDRMATAHLSVVGPLTEPEMLDPEIIAAGCINDIGIEGGLVLIDIAKETVSSIDIESDESYALQELLAELITRNPWQIAARLCREFTTQVEKRFLIRVFANASSAYSSKLCTPSILQDWLVAEWNQNRDQYDEQTKELLRSALKHLRLGRVSELLREQ